MNNTKQDNNILHTINGDFILQEVVTYPNGGQSFFYGNQETAIIIDKQICQPSKDNKIFAYRLLTNKQNEYMSQFEKVYRFLEDDIPKIDKTIADQVNDISYQNGSVDRGNLADATPLEKEFEDRFIEVYGKDSVQTLWKEYPLMDADGHTKYIDYLVQTNTQKFGVEENGVHYHHPQIIQEDAYRKQLDKQNACTNQNIKLFRFSSEDCKFTERMEDDIRSYFGDDSTKFKERGILAERKFVLYDHQKTTLDDINTQRKNGVKSFLIVYPTASGKSKIIEEDIQVFAKEHPYAKYLILVPNHVIQEDWAQRIKNSLSSLENQIMLKTSAYMARHYQEFKQDYFQYIVVDEAHHAVAPTIKKVVQYFNPDFLVGMTATDQRPDNKKLETIFGTYQVSLSLQEAMEKGIIARANCYRIETNIDLSEVRINGKDYVNADLEKSIRITSRNELIVDVLDEYFNDGEVANRQGIIFCVNKTHTKEMERLLQERGISAKAYTSETKHPEKVMQDFKDHKIRFLCACQMISEGWDYPELGILVMARPTLSKVLYIQQLGRGLRKTSTKKNVFVIDVVDQYGSMVQPCSMHTIFHNPYYVPFGDILKQDYHPGEMITVDGLQERIERIIEVDTQSFDEKYGDYLSQEQLARLFFVNTGTITSWIKKKKITPTISFPFGSKTIHMFSKEDAETIRIQQNIPEHTDETIKEDFYAFLEERDYSLSYKMPFLMSFIKNVDATGEANINDVLKDYTSFYQNRIDRNLVVDRATCPFNQDYLKDTNAMKRNMLVNPFEKFERKRFMYYSKDLNVISFNHALHSRFNDEDYERILKQMNDDLKDYYNKLGSTL